MTAARAAVSAADAERTADSSVYDAWELDEQLRHIERVLDKGQGSSCGGSCGGGCTCKTTRIDSSHAGSTSWHLPLTDQSDRGSETPAAASALSLVTWAVVSLGTMALCCGGILLAWSMVAHRQDLWSLGLPIALGGQVALLVGLVLQLDRIFLHNRDTSAKLDTVEGQLRQLRTDAGGDDDPTRALLYAHQAHAAGPPAQLSEMKSQLDLLALKIAREQRQQVVGGRP